MSDVLEALVASANRGVEVTLITPGGDEPDLRFKWHFESKWWGAVATFEAAGFKCRVVDRDGDDSFWELSRHGVLLSEGELHNHERFYHFDACLLAAETSLLEAVRQRKAILTEPRSTSKATP